AGRGADDRGGGERRRADRGGQDGEEGTGCTTEEVSERLIDTEPRRGPGRDARYTRPRRSLMAASVSGAMAYVCDSLGYRPARTSSAQRRAPSSSTERPSA